MVRDNILRVVQDTNEHDQLGSHKKRGHSCSPVWLEISIRKRNGRILAGLVCELEPERTGNSIKQLQQIYKENVVVHLIEKFYVTSTFTISANNWSSGQKVKPYVRNFQPKLVVETLAVHMTKGWFYLSKSVHHTATLSLENLWHEK